MASFPEEVPVAPMLTPPLRVRIHWTARVSFVLSLFFMCFGTATLLFYMSVDGSLRWIVTTLPFVVGYFGGGLYAFVGWIFGLVAFRIARQPAWHKGFALATWGLGIAVALFVLVLVWGILLSLTFHCVSPDSCALSHPLDAM